MKKRADWGDVRINCGFGIFLETREEERARERERAKISRDTADSIRSVLKDSFKGPEEGARAQAAYREWTRRYEEAGQVLPMTPDAQKWRNFQDRWTDFVWQNITREFANFDEFHGVDFSQVRSRSRGGSM